MATKKTTNKEETKKTAAKKTDTAKKTTAKKADTKTDAAVKKTTNKEETKKTTAKKTDTAKKTTAKKIDTKTDAAVKKITTKKAESIKKEPSATTAIKKTDTAKKISEKKEDTKENLKKTITPISSSTKDSTQKTIDNIFKKMAAKDDDNTSSNTSSSSERVFKPLRTSSPIRKIEPIKTTTSSERESITLLKEAIKAKSKNVSKPLTTRKHLVVTDDNINETLNKNTLEEKKENNTEKADNSIESAQNSNIFTKTSSIVNDVLNKKENEIEDKPQTLEEVVKEYKFETFENNNNKTTEEDDKDKEADFIKKELEKMNDDNTIADEAKKEDKEEEKTVVVEEKNSIYEKEDTKEKVTYTKGDIFKNRKVVLPTIMQNTNVAEESKFNQEEIDKAIENAAEIEDNTPIQDYQNYTNKKLKELEEKDIKIIETEEELKTSTMIPEIEKKPVEPYKVPDHSIDDKGNEKKSNKLIPIIGIIIIILGLSFLGFQFMSSKNNNNDDGFYDVVTNENINTNQNYDTMSDISNINAISSNQNNIIKSNTQTTNNIEKTPQITNNIVQTNNNLVKTNNIQTNNTVRTNTAQTNNTVRTNTIQTNTVNTNINIPKEPELPTPPTPPEIPNPPVQNNNNTTAYINGVNNLYKTKWTDTLTSIAINELGDARKWPMIFVANNNVLKDPDKIVFNININIPNDGKKKLEQMSASEKQELYNAYMEVSRIYLELGKTNMANIVKNDANNIIK